MDWRNIHYCGVYILQLVAFENTYKIGKANKISDRIKAFITCYPANKEPQLKYVIYPTDPLNRSSDMLLFLEQLVHNQLKQFRPDDREIFILSNLQESLITVVNYLNKGNFKVQLTTSTDLEPIVLNFDPPETDEEPEINESLPIEIAPYDYQRLVLEKMHHHFESKNKGILVEPPGYGKSYIAGFFIKQHDFSIYQNNQSVIILVPQIAIADDFAKALRTVGLQCNVVSSMHNDQLQSGINIITYQSYLIKKQ